MNKVLPVILAIALLSGLLTTGCGGDDSEHPFIGKPAPDFAFQTLEGHQTSLSSLKGNTVILNFWATRCSPCRTEMTFIQQVHDEGQSKGLVLLAINIGESPAQVGAFMQSQGFSFTVILDTEGVLAGQYGVQAIPTTFFIDPESIVQAMKIGAFSSKAEIDGYLSQIMP